MKYALVFLVLFLVIPVKSVAYIYEVSILEMTNNFAMPKYLIGCSDFHDKTNPANKIHLEKIMKCLQQCNKQAIKIVVEDLSSPNVDGIHTCGQFFVNSRGGVLGGLAQMLIALEFSVENIEFRYCRVSALGPVLNHLDKDMDQFASVNTITVATILREINNAIERVALYNDGPILTAFYKDIIKQIRKDLQSLHLEKHPTLTIAQYLKQHIVPVKRLEVIKKLLTFDSALFDIKLVHSIVTAKTAKILCIAGGSHINNSCQMLEKIGYKIVKNSTTNYEKEYDLKHCLGSHIVDGIFCIKPLPTDMSIIEQWLLK